MPTHITTPRLLLRPVQPEDGPALLPLIDNWNVVKWLAVAPWPYTAADMTWFIDNVATPRADGPDPVFVLLIDGKTPIGVAECKGHSEADAAGPEATGVGFWIGEPYWGKGYMSQALSALVARTFARPKMTVIGSSVFKGNDRSLRVHEKLGFARRGMKMSKCRSRGTELPLITLRLTRDRSEPR